MSTINSINTHSNHAASSAQRTPQQRAADEPRVSPNPQPSEGRTLDRDQVSISEAARRTDADPSIRADLVSRIRQQIESGSYETEDKISLALEELARDIG